MKLNLWLGITATAKSQLAQYLDAEDETIPTNRLQAVRIFRRMADRAVVEKLFRTPTIQGTVWHLYSVSFDLDREGVAAASDAITYLETEYPSHFAVAGAWHWDGRQVGTQWVDDVGGATTGTPTYPLNTTQLLKFMPLVVTEGGLEEPSTLTDVNLIQGQSPRRFA